MATDVGGGVAGSYEYDNEEYDVGDVLSGPPSTIFSTGKMFTSSPTVTRQQQLLQQTTTATTTTTSNTTT